MSPKPERVARATLELARILAHGTMTKNERDTWAGKLEFTTQTGVYGRVGRAAIATIRAHDPETDETIGSVLAEALRFFIEILPLLPPRVFRFGRGKKRGPIVLYTDAMFARRKAKNGRRAAQRGGLARHGAVAKVGVALWDPDPEPGESNWRHASARVPDAVTASFRERSTYI